MTMDQIQVERLASLWGEDPESPFRADPWKSHGFGQQWAANQELMDRPDLGQTRRSMFVGRLQHPDEENVILLLAGKIPTAAQQQMLSDAPFQMPVAALTRAVFLRPSHIDRARRYPVMCANTLILLVKTTFGIASF